MVHQPVLKKEVLEYLDPKTDENFVDCTIGEGGHTTAILKENKPEGRVLGIEADTEIYQNLKRRMAEFSIFNFQFPKRLILINDSYTNLKTIVEKIKIRPVNGILLDLGMSSWHLEKSGRGFSFMKDEILDMRYDPKTNPLTAQEILNQWPEPEIEKILKEYGEERFARGIAKKIISERKTKPIKTTFQLIEIIKKAVPSSYRRGKIPRRSRFAILRGRHFATRTFQALRIAVNDELNNLKKVLPQTIEVLTTGGRVVIISFHSLEDRIVKNFFKNSFPEKLKILTKKPITPAQEEIKINPRSRSAKLRACQKF